MAEISTGSCPPHQDIAFLPHCRPQSHLQTHPSSVGSCVAVVQCWTAEAFHREPKWILTWHKHFCYSEKWHFLVRSPCYKTALLNAKIAKTSLALALRKAFILNKLLSSASEALDVFLSLPGPLTAKNRLQFGYQLGVGVETPSLYLLHRAHSHLDKGSSTVRSLFLAFSRAFKTILI